MNVGQSCELAQVWAIEHSLLLNDLNSFRLHVSEITPLDFQRLVKTYSLFGREPQRLVSVGFRAPREYFISFFV